MGKHKATKTIHQTSQILRSPVSSLTHPRFPWFPKVPRSVARSGGSRTQLTLELWRFDHKTNWDMFLLKFDVQPSHRYTLKVWLSHAKPWNIEVSPLMLKNFTIKIKKKHLLKGQAGNSCRVPARANCYQRNREGTDTPRPQAGNHLGPA